MKFYYKILLFSIITIPIAAYLDAIIIRGMSHIEYLYVCTWEMLIFYLGVLVGFKGLEREIKKK